MVDLEAGVDEPDGAVPVGAVPGPVDQVADDVFAEHTPQSLRRARGVRQNAGLLPAVWFRIFFVVGLVHSIRFRHELLLMRH